MTLSAISSSHFFQPLSSLRSSDTSAPVDILVQPPQPPHARAQETGDSGMLRLYASGIRQAAQTGLDAKTPVAVAQGSRFGGWWQHLYDLAHSPMFVAWAAAENIDTSQPIEISPQNGSLTVTVNGRRTTYGVAPRPGARDVIEPLMVAAQALSPGVDFNAPADPFQAPLQSVAHFYGEVLLPDDKARTQSRATQLEHNQAFDVLGADTYVNLKAQSPELLQQEKGKLGDDVNKYRLRQKLQDYRTPSYISLESFLTNARVPTHPDSYYALDTQRSDASLKDLLSHSGWHVPENDEQMDNLKSALAAQALPAPPYGDFGGAVSWPVPMSLADQGSLFAIIADNSPPLPGLDADARLGTVDVLGALMKKAPRSVLDQKSDLKTIEWILSCDAGTALGEALKQRMGEVAENSSPEDMLLTALAITLDAKGLDNPQANHIAGFNLASPEFFAQPLSVIKQKLTEHLASSLVTTSQAASVAATLLLSRAAPELLVSGVPSGITYGSFAWLAHKAAVDRIEAMSPGATRSMSFEEVAAFDAIDPVTDSDQAIQAQSAVAGIIQWGRANGTLPLQGEYSAAQVTDTQRAISVQQQRMLRAVDALGASVPTQRSVALAALRARYGDNVPFEEKSITARRTETDRNRLTPSISLDPSGRYSLLDLYLSGKDSLDVGWTSPNPLIDGVLWELETLPDPIQTHEQAFRSYADDLSDAWAAVTEHLIANLPVEDRKNLVWGDLTVYQRGRSQRSVLHTPNGGASYTRFLPNEADRHLIIETVRHGSTTYYEVDPQRNVLRRRDDWKDNFKEGVQGPEVKTSNHSVDHFTAPTIERMIPSSENADKEKGTVGRQDLPQSFSSPRSQYLGQLLSRHVIQAYRMGDLKDSTREVTTFDKEEEVKALMRGVVLGLIPGGSAIWNLAHGNFAEAAADVIFDVVMSTATSELGKGTGAAKGLRAVRKPFGSGLLRGFGKLTGAGAEGGASILAGLRQKIRSPGVAKFKQSGVHLNQRQARLVDERIDLFEGTAKTSDGPGYYQTIALNHKGRWYAYDPVTDKPFGKPLADFKATTKTHLDTKFHNLSRKAENGPTAAAFQEGYKNGDPSSVPGYSPSMNSAQVKKLAVTHGNLTAKQMGILVRQQERLAVQHGLNGASIFSHVVRDAGGSVTPMPQIFYLSQTQPLSKGQCAALSNLMAEASRNGKAGTLIDNVYTAAANPKAQSSKDFIATLAEFQKRVETPTGFHGRAGSQVPSVPYTSIADNLGSSPVTKTLMIGDEAHAMTAGVIVDGSKRSYFFFDPNYGVANFPSTESMRTGMRNIFNNKQFSRPYKSTGLPGKELEFRISEYDGKTPRTVGANEAALASTYTTPL
ncbi:hypothetical protein [Pseudomonas sp. MUP55]|uniref:hypothetical protein n=1 Tax=Pseudomonas sp. MUP55 TaxID=3087234 RepID=UPI002A5A51AF|nr:MULTISPECIES: hypothetical protein [unclassified Pseudomonas]WPN95280.1 hypothetical protein SC319_13190 [Pseudomonas sp. MUP56]WPO00808.1 hypothetical protein SC318_13190 [Pseudomonas sp. MUP55]